MTLNSLVKEIQIDKGVFSIKSSTGKFSASESYKEQLIAGNLPSDAPKEFKEATNNLYYVPENRDLVSYNVLHGKINHEKELILSSIQKPTEEDRKKAQVDSSKKILKENSINDKTLLIYSPVLTSKLSEQDAFTKISATYNHSEKIIYVKTELIRKSSEDVITPSHSALGQHDVDKERKVDIDAIKQKYHFKKPQGKSISEILGTSSTHKEEKIEVSHHKDIDPEQELKNIINESLGSVTGIWEGSNFVANKKESGYLVPVEEVYLYRNEIVIRSSPFINIEWWTKFTPINQCPRFGGALDIEDYYTPFCIEGKCNQACGAEDGFVELSAGRFRLVDDSHIIKNSFKRLQEFLDRTHRLVNDFKETFQVEINMYMDTQHPYFYSKLKRPVDENELRNYISAYQTLYPEITDIRGNIDIEEFIIDDDYDPLSESGLVKEAKNYCLQEMVRLNSKDLLEEVVNTRNGKIDSKFYLIDNGKMRYVLRPNKIEAIRDELYMGSVTFKKGINEVKNFLSVTLGGGRW